jgi:hypothetical protein
VGGVRVRARACARACVRGREKGVGRSGDGAERILLASGLPLRSTPPAHLSASYGTRPNQIVVACWCRKCRGNVSGMVGWWDGGLAMSCWHGGTHRPRVSRCRPHEVLMHAHVVLVSLLFEPRLRRGRLRILPATGRGAKRARRFDGERWRTVAGALCMDASI